MEQPVTGALVKDHTVVTEGWRPGSGPIPRIPGLVAAGYGVVTISARHPGRKRRTGRRSFPCLGAPAGFEPAHTAPEATSTSWPRR